MPTIIHGFDWPDRVVVGAVEELGSRSFYLQARTGRRIASVALEKEQSALLAEKIEEILDELMDQQGNPASVPMDTPIELVDNDPLEQPVDAEFRIGVMSLGWDPSTAQLVIKAYPLVLAEEGATDQIETEPTEMMLVRIPVGTARAFAKRTLEVVGAGRSICSLCGTPIDPEGHVHARRDDL